MNKQRPPLLLTAIAALFVSTSHASANNIQVTNVTLSPGGADWAYVEFDVSWDNSWRAEWVSGSTWTNWDAAWVFVKYRVEGGESYSHASLATNDIDHTVPADATLNVGLTDTNGVGVFIYRSATNSGSVDYNSVKLKWLYDQDGVANTANVDISVHAIEMVYVPEGSFDAGDDTAGTVQGQFEDGTSGNPLRITSEASLTLGGGGGGSLGNNNKVGMDAETDDFDDSTSQTLPAAFPKGYAAFYCMKYETTQGQYAEFLNELTAGQVAARYDAANYGTFRYTITNTGTYIAEAPDRAAGVFMSWGDGSAYADWAGLRPMTELEFEKACRGPITAAADELAWGGISPTSLSGHSGVDGSGTETATPAGANCCFNNAITGPVRVGIFATTNSSRTGAGATYWGIMEMSGNAWERAVTVGNAAGRSFTGTHGDGTLTAGGERTNADWPSPTTANGAGCRGGNWNREQDRQRVSARRHAAQFRPARSMTFSGWRAVRLAP